MSKELIEQLRELSASRKPYATGAHGQIIGMESYRIVANGFALECIDEAADRIEDLERDLLNLVCRIHRDGGHYIAKYGEAKAIADADTVAAQNNADLDALQVDSAELVAALERMRVAGGSQEFHIAWELAKDVLTKVRKPT